MTLCPRCTNGTWTDSNKVARSCHYCGGTGHVAEAEVEPTDWMLRVTADRSDIGLPLGSEIVARPQGTVEAGGLAVVKLGEEHVLRPYPVDEGTVVGVVVGVVVEAHS